MAARSKRNPTQLQKDRVGRPASERELREQALDDTVAASFPASDPLSSDPNPLPEEDDRLAS